MKSLGVISAVFNPDTGFIEVAKEIVNDDDTIEYAGQSFHPETLEWWSAVYDTDDLDELIDMILHEPHVENIEPLKMSAEEARAAQKTKVDRFKATHKVTKAPSSTGLPKKFVDAAAQNPYQVIKDACPLDPEVVKVKRAYIQSLREQSIAQTQGPTEDRATLLKARLNRGQRATPQQGQESIVPSRPLGALPTIKLEGKRKRTE